MKQHTETLIDELQKIANQIRLDVLDMVYRRKAGGFTDEDPKLWDEIKAEGDAMIMGMGH